MGRTLPPFRSGLRSEIEAWKPYRRALGKMERQLFDEMIDESARYWSAASNTPRPFLFESLSMMVIFAHYAKLSRIRGGIEGLRGVIESRRRLPFALEHRRPLLHREVEPHGDGGGDQTTEVVPQRLPYPKDLASREEVSPTLESGRL